MVLSCCLLMREHPRMLECRGESLLLDAPVQATLERVGSRGNTGDLDSQPFYKFIQRTYAWHVVGMFAVLYALGGLPALVWGGALRAVWVYHITWFVNSASHCWGYQARARSPWGKRPCPYPQNGCGMLSGGSRCGCEQQCMAGV